MKGLATPKRVGCIELLFLCRYEGLTRSLLLDWYLGSQKLREIFTLLYCITLSSSREKPTQCSRGSKKDFWRCCRGDLRQVKSSQDIPSTHHKLISLAFTFFFHLPLVFLSPTSPLPFYSPSLSVRLFSACFIVMTSPLSTPLSPKNEFLNFKQREGENLKDACYRICNAQNRSTRKQSTLVLLRNFYVGINPWNRYILDCHTLASHASECVHHV